MNYIIPIEIFISWVFLFIILLYFLFHIKSFNLSILVSILLFYTIQGYFVFFMYEYLGFIGSHTEVVMDYPYYASSTDAMFYSVFLVSLFWVSYVSPLLLRARKESTHIKMHSCNRFELNALKLLLIGLILVLAFVLYFYSILIEGFETGAVYLTYKGSFVDMPFGRVFQQILLIAAVFFLLGTIKGQYGKYLYINNNRYLRVLNIFAIALVFLMMAILGDKITVVGAILFVCCVGQLSFKPSARATAVILLILSIGNSISVIRFTDFSKEWSFLGIIIDGFLSLFEHAESVTSLSLYVALKNQIPYTYGASFLDAIYNLIPSFLYQYKKVDPFTYYSSFFVPSDNTVGWGISIFTDLYINFSIIGVFLGGFLLGIFHLYLHRKSKSSFLHLLIFSSIVSMLPTYYRNGINISGIIYSYVVAILIYFFIRNLLVKRFVFSKVDANSVC